MSQHILWKYYVDSNVDQCENLERKMRIWRRILRFHGFDQKRKSLKHYKKIFISRSFILLKLVLTLCFLHTQCNQSTIKGSPTKAIKKYLITLLWTEAYLQRKSKYSTVNLMMPFICNSSYLQCDNIVFVGCFKKVHHRTNSSGVLLALLHQISSYLENIHQIGARFQCWRLLIWVPTNVLKAFQA